MDYYTDAWFSPQITIRNNLRHARFITWKTTVNEYLLTNWDRDEILLHLMVNNIRKLYFHDMQKIKLPTMMNSNSTVTLFSAVGQINDNEKLPIIYFVFLTRFISINARHIHSCSCDIFVSQDLHLFLKYILTHSELKPTFIKGNNINQYKTIKDSIEKQDDIHIKEEQDIRREPIPLQFFCMESVYKNRINYEHAPFLLKRYLKHFIWMKTMQFEYM